MNTETVTTETITETQPAVNTATQEAPAPEVVTEPVDGIVETPAGTELNADGTPKVEEPAKTNEEVETKETKEGEEKDAEKAEPRAPETYDLKVAEGVALTPELKTQFEAIARELDLPQADAQKMLDLAPELSKMFTSQLIDTAAKTSQVWAGEARADAEIGGGGDEKILAANMSVVAKGRDAFATPGLLKLLAPFDPKENPNGTGFGNHPEVIRLFLHVGKSIGEDNKLVTGGFRTDDRSPADRLYSKTNKQ